MLSAAFCGFAEFSGFNNTGSWGIALKRVLIIACVLVLAAPSYADIINVTLETNYGDIGLELNSDAAPITVDNFVNYVNEGFYDGLIFHSVINDLLMRAGSYDQDLYYITPTHDPIVNESDNGLSNLKYTIAMDRGSAADSATSQFYINLKDNLHKDKAIDGIGYAVFGEVVFGMDVVDAIAELTTDWEQSPDAGWMSNVPNDDVIIIDAYVIPEPATIIMLAMGGLSLIRRKTK